MGAGLGVAGEMNELLLSLAEAGVGIYGDGVDVFFKGQKVGGVLGLQTVEGGRDGEAILGVAFLEGLGEAGEEIVQTLVGGGQPGRGTSVYLVADGLGQLLLDLAMQFGSDGGAQLFGGGRAGRKAADAEAEGEDDGGGGGPPGPRSKDHGLRGAGQLPFVEAKAAALPGLDFVAALVAVLEVGLEPVLVGGPGLAKEEGDPFFTFGMFHNTKDSFGVERG